MFGYLTGVDGSSWSRKEKGMTEDGQDEEDMQVKGVENGNVLDGIYNRGFTDDDRFTKL